MNPTAERVMRIGYPPDEKDGQSHCANRFPDTLHKSMSSHLPLRDACDAPRRNLLRNSLPARLKMNLMKNLKITYLFTAWRLLDCDRFFDENLAQD